jgi:hypothetical protein
MQEAGVKSGLAMTLAEQPYGLANLNKNNAYYTDDD